MNSNWELGSISLETLSNMQQLIPSFRDVYDTPMIYECGSWVFGRNMQGNKAGYFSILDGKEGATAER